MVIVQTPYLESKPQLGFQAADESFVIECLSVGNEFPCIITGCVT
jgi:hypothetical protein